MISDKLLSLIRTFTKYELNSVRKFLVSPFFNENQDIIRLFDLINKTVRINDPVKADKLLQKNTVWKELFGDSPYDDNTLRRLSSELTRLVGSFLAYRHFSEDPFNEQVYLLSAINRSKLDKHFNGAVRQAEGFRENAGLRDAGYHYKSYRLEQERHRHLEIMDPQITNLDRLVQSDYHLDCYYITTKLKNYCDVLGTRKRATVSAEIRLFDGFLEEIRTGHYLEEPAVKAYYIVANMLLFPDDEFWYQACKVFLEENYQYFSRQEQNTLYTHLKNYCISTKINNGRSDYFRELFIAYQSSLEKNILNEDGFLPPNHYKNIISIGLHIKEFSWVKEFIREYTDQLPEGNKDNALSYNLAKVYFHEKQYQKVIEQLRSVEYENVLYALGGKLMLLKTYYELNEHKALDSLIDSFRIYLRRNQTLSKEKQQQYMNVLRFTKKLVSVAPYDKPAVHKMREQILECKALAEKEWLLEKTAVLM